MDLLIYLGKASLILTLFWVIYKLFLEVETYHRFKRIYLLAGYVVSLILPLFTYTQIEEITLTSTGFLPNSSEFVPVDISKSPLELFWAFVIEHSILELMYLAISLVFFIHLGLKFFKLLRFLKRSRVLKTNGSLLIEKAIPEGAFSFLNYIVYNPDLYSEDELNIILAHEQAHVHKRHSFDILLAHVYKCFFWFNPFAWLYQKSLVLNLEYEADAKVVNTTAKRDYQMTLYSITQQQYKHQLQHSFNQSPIKKRIAMLNKNKHNSSLWKLFIVSPLLVIFFLLFQIETKAQIKEADPSLTVDNTSNFEKELAGIENAENFIINGKKITKRRLAETYIPVDDFKYDGASKTLSITTRSEFSKPYYSDNLAMLKEVQLRHKDKALGEFVYFMISSDYKVATMRIENIKTSENTKKPLLNKNISLSNMPSKSEKRFLDTKSKYSAQNMVMIVDGVKAKKGEPVNIDTDQIESVEILKSPEELKALGYNSNFVDAVIKITTKTKKEAIINAPQHHNSTLNYSNKFPNQNIIFILDGKEIEESQMSKIKPDEIKSVTVIKDSKQLKAEGYDPEEVDGLIKIIRKTDDDTKSSQPENAYLEFKRELNALDGQLIYIVDGRQVNEKRLDKINPNIIESMFVIKKDNNLERNGFDPKKVDAVIQITTKN